MQGIIPLLAALLQMPGEHMPQVMRLLRCLSSCPQHSAALAQVTHRVPDQVPSHMAVRRLSTRCTLVQWIETDLRFQKGRRVRVKGGRARFQGNATSTTPDLDVCRLRETNIGSIGARHSQGT